MKTSELLVHFFTESEEVECPLWVRTTSQLSLANYLFFFQKKSGLRYKGGATRSLTNAVSFYISFFMSLEKHASFFSKKSKLYFITFKSHLVKWQKIGTISDHMRKVSDNFLVVRESNKQKEGYHFHVLASLKKDFYANWYRKDVHIHVSGYKRTDISMFISHSQDDDEIAKYGMNPDEVRNATQEELLDAEAMVKASKAYAKVINHNNLYKRVLRTLTYMSKELDPIVMYENYLFRKDNKVCKDI